MKAGDILMIKGIETLILEVDQWGGYLSMETANLRKPMSELDKNFTGDPAQTVLEFWKSEPRLSKYAETLDKWDRENPALEP